MPLVGKVIFVGAWLSAPLLGPSNLASVTNSNSLCVNWWVPFTLRKSPVLTLSPQKCQPYFPGLLANNFPTLVCVNPNNCGSPIRLKFSEVKYSLSLHSFSFARTSPTCLEPFYCDSLWEQPLFPIFCYIIYHCLFRYILSVIAQSKT